MSCGACQVPAYLRDKHYNRKQVVLVLNSVAQPCRGLHTISVVSSIVSSDEWTRRAF